VFKIKITGSFLKYRHLAEILISLVENNIGFAEQKRNVNHINIKTCPL